MHDTDDDSEDAAAIAAFMGPDEHAARAAFDELLSKAVGMIRRRLEGFRLQAADVDDLIITVCVNAWNNRYRFTNRHFFAWMRRIADNAAYDLIRKKRFERFLAEVPEREASDRSFADFFDRSALHEIYHQADVLFLGLNAALSEDEHYRRLIAIQLHYLDGWRIEDILETLPEPPLAAKALTRYNVELWFKDAGLWRHLAYVELLHTPEELAAHLLGPNLSHANGLEDCRHRTGAKSDDAGAARDWTQPEVDTILWHYYRGLTVKEFEHYPVSSLTARQITALFNRCEALFPFRDQVMMLCPWIENTSPRHAALSMVLAEAGIWQRLAFEYWYRYSLPQRDIHKRTAGAAELAEYTITQAMLTNWISAHKLLDRLTQHFANRERWTRADA